MEVVSCVNVREVSSYMYLAKFGNLTRCVEHCIGVSLVVVGRVRSCQLCECTRELSSYLAIWLLDKVR